MLCDPNFKFTFQSLQKNKDDSLHFQSNTTAIQVVFPISQPAPLRKGFSVDIIHKDHHLYEMVIQNPSHYLGCALRMKVEDYRAENEMVAKIVVCYFPKIDDELLKKFIEWDGMFYDILTVQFQMIILKRLLLFCVDHCAFQLAIYTNHTDCKWAKKFSIYAHFLSHYAETFDVHKQKLEILIPVSSEIINQWINFMDRTSQGFRQTLQKERNSNYVVHLYLKWDPYLQFFY